MKTGFKLVKEIDLTPFEANLYYRNMPRKFKKTKQTTVCAIINRPEELRYLTAGIHTASNAFGSTEKSFAGGKNTSGVVSEKIFEKEYL